MSNTILSGDLTVYYLSENNQKRITWTGGATKSDTRKMINVYSAIQDLFTVATQMDDGIILSAETSGEYTIGKIDAGDKEPWFIDLKTMEHIVGDFANFTGCALKTSGWKRVVDSNAGIVVVAVTNASNNIVEGDIGYDISHGDGDAGTLLDVVVPGGATDYLFIRPDSSAAANNFDSVTGTLTCNAHTATQSAAAVSGEMVWGNVYTQGGIQDDTHIYMYQNGERITGSDQTDNDWWIDGHIDRSVPITDYTTDDFPTIDEGYITVYARRYNTLNSYAIIRMNTTSGGNVSAPLSCSVDSNNVVGYASIALTGGADNWNVGDEISGDVSGARAIITSVVGANPTPTLHYYYVGDPLTVFNGSEAITNEDDTGTASGSGSPANQGPALSSWFDGASAPTITFTAVTADIDDDGTDEPYAASFDLNQSSLAQFYEWLKYVQRRGSTFDLDSLDGQEFIGIDYRVNYSGTVTGTVSEGATVEDAVSGATAVVVSHDTTEKILMLRNHRGTFGSGVQIQVDGSNYIPASGTTVEAITPVADCSFGKLAGGIYFGSPGILITDYKSTEENSFQLIDANGVSRQRPTTAPITIENVRVHDWASIYRLDSEGGVVEKDRYACVGGESIGDADITVSGSISTDEPGKSVGGSLVLVDASDDNQEYNIRYSSWVGSVFTLANATGTAEGGTDTDTIVDTGVFADAKVGDLVYNSTRSAISYVTDVVSDDEISIYPAIAAQTTGDAFELNCVPVIPTSSDKIYVPLILEYVTSGTSIGGSVVFSAPIYGLCRVRNTSLATIKIRPYTSNVTITSTGGTATATRNPDSVYNG